jgi:hypothetical protein
MNGKSFRANFLLINSQLQQIHHCNEKNCINLNWISWIFTFQSWTWLLKLWFLLIILKSTSYCLVYHFASYNNIFAQAIRGSFAQTSIWWRKLFIKSSGDRLRIRTVKWSVKQWTWKIKMSVTCWQWRKLAMPTSKKIISYEWLPSSW